MGGYALFLLPAVVVSLILILISWRWGRNIYRKENRPVQGFFFGTSLYLLLVFLALGITNVLLVGYAHTVADDVSFAVGLIFSIFFITSIQILYVGLLICMGLLIYSTRSSPEEPSQAPSPLAIQFRYAVMGVMIIFALYIFGLAAPIATATHQQWLCNLVYSSRAKADCLLNTSAIAASENAAQNSGNSGTFTIVKTDYKQIKDLHEVGGKLAYAFENNDGTSGVAYDGQVVSGAYQKVGILPIAEVGGKLAYEAYKGDKEIIVWDGQEFGTSYNRASQPTDIGGKLAFVAEIGKKYFVVYDGKEYGREADGAGRPTSIQGKLAYAADTNINGGQYVVFDGKQVGGRYGRVEWIKDEDGHLVFEGVNGNGTLLVVDGKEYGFGYGQIQNHVLIDGKLAFSAQKDGKTVIVYEGTEIGTGSSYEAGPYNIKGQLAYIAANPDGTSQLMVGGQAVGPVMSGSVRNVDVSKGGRVVVQIDDGSKQCRGVVHGPIYLDGEKVYEGCSSNPFGFFGEKLLFWTQEGGDKALWYDGKKIGQGFYGYNYFAVVDGKLAIAAFASAGQGVQYSLLLEQ
ncbi:hypothetical protein A2852_00090 [Candidatus Adlerbacteria bacterium RIFCSPHIGHO2_01_FULL_54_23]|nr:MAG: hypothetical protein A2852_00090 [Candidatus Adlerbacteria bacterium RIFCSPHIGHO2_01_FULL_54_23]OGC87438.1 MAG: hypothetical protein A3B33_02175 [Candidatus Adlerbacteria bacterium RIFCSPLOWO2_01_FULL_54_16]